MGQGNWRSTNQPTKHPRTLMNLPDNWSDLALASLIHVGM